MAGRPARHDEHGHARGGRHDRGLGLQRRRHALARTSSSSAGLEPVTYFDSSTIIIGLVLLGRWLEARAKGRTTGAIRRLVGLSPATARRRRATATDREVALEAVAVGDLLRVRPGDRIPVDGVVVEGGSAVDARC